MKVTSTKDQSLSKINALLIGPSGCGKTTSLKTLPEKGTVIACAERGLLPLRGMGYHVFQMEDWLDLRTLHKMFRKPEGIEEEATKSIIDGAKVLVIDSLSEISDMCIKHIVTVDRRRMVEERTKGKRKDPEGIYEEQMTLEDWGLYATRIQDLLSAFAHLPVHFVVTCIEAQKDDKDGGCRLRTVNLSGKSVWSAPAYFDIVLNMKPMKSPEGKDVRVWQTYNDGERMAKDASGVLDPYEETNWTKLFKKILATDGAKK